MDAVGLDFAPSKYMQVAEEIKRRIYHGQYPPGDLLPSEHRLVSEFGVSRPTIVKALSSLRQDGWIETQQGKGSIALSPMTSIGANARKNMLVREIMVAETSLIGPVSITQAGVKVAPPKVASLLKLEPKAKAFLRQRAWLLHGEINDLASLWMPLDLAAGTDLASPDLLDESLRRHLQARKNVILDQAQERIIARNPTGEEASLLDVDNDESVLEAILTITDVTGAPAVVLSAVRLGNDDSIQDAFRITDGFRSTLSIESMPDS